MSPRRGSCRALHFATQNGSATRKGVPDAFSGEVQGSFVGCRRLSVRTGPKKYQAFVAEGIIGQQLRSQGKVRPYTEARALAALLVHESSHLSLTESGKFLDRNIAPLGRAGRLLASSAGTDSLIAERIEELRRELGMAESQS